jgi:hypothetical protein
MLSRISSQLWSKFDSHCRTAAVFSSTPAIRAISEIECRNPCQLDPSIQKTPQKLQMVGHCQIMNCGRVILPIPVLFCKFATELCFARACISVDHEAILLGLLVLDAQVLGMVKTG